MSSSQLQIAMQTSKTPRCGVPHEEFDVECVTTLEGLHRLTPSWRSFVAAGVYGNNIFADPAHIAVRIRTAEMGTPLNEWPPLAPCIIVLRKAGQIQCIAPFCLVRDRFCFQFSRLSWKLHANIAKLLGGQVLVANDEDYSECCSMVFRALAKQIRSQGYACIERLDRSSVLWRECRDREGVGKSFRVIASTDSSSATVHRLVLSRTYEEHLLARSASTRKTLRRMGRKLFVEQNARVIKVTAADQVPSFLDQIDAIFSKSWQAKVSGYRPRNTPPQLAYFTAMAEQGLLRSYVLVNDQGPIAFELGLQHDGVFYGRETGYDPKWADLSPGAVLMDQVVEDLFNVDSPRVLDFGCGDQPYKRSLASEHHLAGTLFLVPSNSWRIAFALQSSLDSTYSLLRSVVAGLRLESVARSLLIRRSKSI